MMQIGILGGTGPLGRGLATRLAVTGVEVVLGSRDAGRAEEAATELVASWPGRSLAVSGGDNEAAAACDLVVVSTPWEAVTATVRSVEKHLDGKVVVSVANALVKDGRELHPVVPARGSVAAAVQAAAPGALVSAACHHLPAGDLADLDHVLAADVLVCSDHAEAKDATLGLLGTVDGLRPLDAGGLALAAPVEAFTAVLITLNIRYRAHTTLRLGGLAGLAGSAGGDGS